MACKLKPLCRRTFLRGSGVAVALPFLEAMQPSRARAHTKKTPPMRLVCVGNPYGMLPDAFFPEETGAGYQLTRSLQPLAEHRNHMTVFSHLDHDLSGGHSAAHTFLSGVKSKDAAAMPDGNITIDQRAAEFVGSQTRFPVLNLAVGSGWRMSWSRNGIRIPPVEKAADLFRALFVDDNPREKLIRAERYELYDSILDSVRHHARSLHHRLGQADRQKLEEYLTSVRDVEKRLQMSQQWLDKPKPHADLELPREGTFVEMLPVFFDLLALALQTDSTRVATLEIPKAFATTDLGLSTGYHSYSHHGKAEHLRDGLLVIERFQMSNLARFLQRLKSIREPEVDGTLLDRTMVLFGSGLGNGSSHSNKDLPILLAGGGFQHGQHRRYSKSAGQRMPLCNLYLRMLQKFGLPIDQFGTSTTAINEI